MTIYLYTVNINFILFYSDHVMICDDYDTYENTDIWDMVTNSKMNGTSNILINRDSVSLASICCLKKL